MSEALYVHELRLVVTVDDYDEAVRFYRDVLGAEPVPIGKGFAYRFGSVQLNCHGPDQIGFPRAQVPVMPGGSDLCFEWHGPINDAIRHLEQHGVPVELGPVERTGARGLGQSVYFRDPDGSLLEFITYGQD